MECPRCKERMKRLRTVDKGSTVIRYNRCMECGEKVKSIELYLVEYESETTRWVQRAVRAESQARQLSLNLDTIKTAFRHLHDAVTPLQEAEARKTPVSRFPVRYTKSWRSR